MAQFDDPLAVERFLLLPQRLWDLALAYQLSDNYKLGLTASNLGNKRYVGACYDQNNCWMGAERSVELNLYASF